MYIYCIIFASLFAACQGAASSRNSNLNLYYLYTQDNFRTPELVPATEAGIKASSISFDRPTIILVHGHEGSAFTSLNPVVKDAVLAIEDVNLIAVDWSTYAGLSYSAAVAKVPTIAANIAEFIQLIVDESEVEADSEGGNINIVNPNTGIIITPRDEDKDSASNTQIFKRNKNGESPLVRMHLVGFGLGAHLVGVVGRLLNGEVAKITGLDPSGSLWGSNADRLRSSDAVYVEVLHTDGGGLLSNGIGEVLGDIDFFANGGSNQPGCITHACSHNRAYELFAASMENPNLIGYPCSSNAQLTFNLCRGQGVPIGGTSLNKNGSGGIYRVNTGRRWPF